MLHVHDLIIVISILCTALQEGYEFTSKKNYAQEIMSYMCLRLESHCLHRIKKELKGNGACNLKWTERLTSVD